MLQALGASADWESTGAHNGPVVLATHEAFQELPLAGQAVACGILWDKGSNPCPLHGQVDS